MEKRQVDACKSGSLPDLMLDLLPFCGIIIMLKYMHYNDIVIRTSGEMYLCGKMNEEKN